MPEITDSQAEPAAVVTPPWGSDDQFDAAKAWQLIEGLRADKTALASRPVMTDEQKQQLTEYQALVAASQTDAQRKDAELAAKALEVSNWQSEAERWRTTSVTNRIEALAGQDFADPSDAAAALSEPGKYLDAGGVIDEAAIKADLASLLDRKPHYRRPDGVPVVRTPAPNHAQGSSANGATPADPAAEFAALLRQKMT